MRRMFQLLVALVLLLGVTIPLAAQEDRVEIIFAGEPNTTGGTYCFGGDDVRRVNALWHVVGSKWREALKASENAGLREPLYGKARESIRDGVTYYAVAKGECFFVPAPITARVDLFYHFEPAMKDGNAPPRPDTPAPVPNPRPNPNWWDIATGIILMTGICLVVWWDRRRAKAERERIAAEMAEWERTHPAEAGPPVITGGFEALPQYTRYDTVVDQLRQTASISSPGTVRRDWRVVDDIVRGRLQNCDGMVTYSEGTEPQKRHFTDEPAFRALMEHIPTGDRSMKFILWACMNGCWTGMVEGTLNFVPDTNQAGEPVLLSPVVLATDEQVRQYGDSLYGPNRNLLDELREAELRYFGPHGRSRVPMCSSRR